MGSFNLFFLIILVNINLLTCQIVVSLVNLFIKTFDIHIFFSKKTFLYLDVDTESQYTWISSLLFNRGEPTGSTFITKNKFNITGLEVGGTLYSDSISLLSDKGKNITTEVDINFISVEDNISESLAFEAVAAFAFHIDNEKYSITHMLYNKGLIGKRSFSFDMNNNDPCLMYFGGVPEEKQKDKYSTLIKVQDYNEKWNIKLNYFYFEKFSNVKYRNDYGGYFSTSTMKIFVPKSTYMVIYDRYIKRHIDSHECSIISRNQDIECSSKAVQDVGSIIFVLDNIKFEKTGKELFRFDGFHYLFLVSKNTKSDEWVFGIGFFIKYITTFNYDSKSIVFHSQTPFEEFQLNNHNNNILNIKKVKTLFIVNIIILIVISLYDGVCKYKYK